MTEAEWLACDDPRLLLERARSLITNRRARLFACASCWKVALEWPLADFVAAVESAEKAIDSLATPEELVSARATTEQWIDSPATALHYLAETVELAMRPEALNLESVQRVVESIGLVYRDAVVDSVGMDDFPYQAALIRCIFGNPFRPVTLAPEWLTSTVVALARQMYESRDFGAMPILADALQDAGCDSEDILDHCRGDGPHVRGCWVVDLVLGKT
jgi:hypothetical protein